MIKPVNIIFSILILLLVSKANACGWAGDGELKYLNLLPGIVNGGREIPQTLNHETIKLPQGLGYGLVVVEPGQGIPYLQLTLGRPINRVEDLRAFGVRAIVDLGSRDAFAAVKSVIRDLQNLEYFNIAVEAMKPDAARIENFHNLLLSADKRPLLVIAPNAEVLAITWAAYRLRLGAPRSYAIYEARSMGLQSVQESVLLNW